MKKPLHLTHLTTSIPILAYLYMTAYSIDGTLLAGALACMLCSWSLNKRNDFRGQQMTKSAGTEQAANHQCTYTYYYLPTMIMTQQSKPY
jgi:hypothetical protein